MGTIWVNIIDYFPHLELIITCMTSGSETYITLSDGGLANADVVHMKIIRGRV